MATYKHLTLSERVEIYALLKANKSIRKIAKELKRYPTTISKEIKKHLEIRETFFEDNRRPARFAVLTKQKPPTVADGFGVGCGELWGGSAALGRI